MCPVLIELLRSPERRLAATVAVLRPEAHGAIGGGGDAGVGSTKSDDATKAMLLESPPELL
jgi:hypothetical protein